MIKIATPTSSLLKNSSAVLEIGNHSDCWECRDNFIDFPHNKQEVFHCDIQPIHTINNNQLEYLQKIKSIKPELKLITFHCASCCDAPIIDENGIFQVGGLKYSRSEMLQNAKENFLLIKEIFGSQIKIAIENNNYYPSDAYEFVTDPSFISSIVYDNDIYFLFDIAHAAVTCLNKKIYFNNYKDDLPLDRTVQLHICRHGLKENGVAYDAHRLPGAEEIKEVKNLIAKFKIKYLTVEFYKDKNKLIRCLDELRKII